MTKVVEGGGLGFDPSSLPGMMDLKHEVGLAQRQAEEKKGHGVVNGDEIAALAKTELTIGPWTFPLPNLLASRVVGRIDDVYDGDDTDSVAALLVVLRNQRNRAFITSLHRAKDPDEFKAVIEAHDDFETVMFDLDPVRIAEVLGAMGGLNADAASLAGEGGGQGKAGPSETVRS